MIILTRSETSKIIAVLKTEYPRSYQGLSADELRNKILLWSELLEDLSYSDVNIAIRRWMATEKWPPTISDIRSLVVQSTETEADHEWVDAWGEVERAIRNFGFYRELEALNSMSPVTRTCVQAIGWKNICNSEEIGVERGHFRSMYESKAGSVRKAKQIQPALRTEGEACMLEIILGNVAKRLN